MEPITKRGYVVWDRGILPGDEFFERIRLIRAEMRDNGLDALVVFGNAYDDAQLNYFTGAYIDGGLVITAEGDPAMISSGGSREIYFQKLNTWIEDVSAAPAMGPAVLAALKARGVTRGAVGVAGARILSGKVYAGFLEALSGFKIRESDDLVGKLLRQPRDREVLAVETSLAIAEAAVAAGQKVHAAGGSNTDALNEAERVARRLRAWDVRCLANLDGDDLRPLDRLSTLRQEPLLLWVGVRHQGYWADAVAPGALGGEAAKALEAMIAAASAGAAASDVAKAGTGRLSPASAESALAYGLGGGIGLTLSGQPVIAPGNAEKLLDGELLSLRVFASGDGTPSFANAIVRVGRSGGVRLKARTLDWSL